MLEKGSDYYIVDRMPFLERSGGMVSVSFQQ